MSRARSIWLVARRGPQHAAFTTVELRELVNTPDLRVTVEDGVLDGILAAVPVPR